MMVSSTGGHWYSSIVLSQRAVIQSGHGCAVPSKHDQVCACVCLYVSCKQDWYSVDWGKVQTAKKKKKKKSQYTFNIDMVSIIMNWKSSYKVYSKILDIRYRTSHISNKHTWEWKKKCIQQISCSSLSDTWSHSRRRQQKIQLWNKRNKVSP